MGIWNCSVLVEETVCQEKKCDKTGFLLIFKVGNILFQKHVYFDIYLVIDLRSGLQRGMQFFKNFISSKITSKTTSSQRLIDNLFNKNNNSIIKNGQAPLNFTLVIFVHLRFPRRNTNRRISGRPDHTSTFSCYFKIFILGEGHGLLLGSPEQYFIILCSLSSLV